MVIKSREYFERTRHIKNNEKAKKFVLRGERNMRHHEKKLSNKTKSYNFLEDKNRYKGENFSVILYFNKLSNDISHNVVA